MKILKEGTIAITPDAEVLVTGFHVEGGNLQDLELLVLERVNRAVYKLRYGASALTSQIKVQP